MTAPGPNVMFWLTSLAEQNRCQSLLLDDLAWQGQFISPGVSVAGTVSSAGGQAASAMPDVVVLDRFEPGNQQQILQQGATSPPAIVWLLEDGATPPSLELAASPVYDYLFKSQLQGNRLGLTIRNLWQQRLLQRQLDDCLQLKEVFRQVGVGVNQADASGRYIRVNQRFCDLLGYSEAELLQLTYQEVTHPEDLEHQTELERQLFAGEIEATTFEKRFIAKNGDTVWTRITLSMFYDEAHRPTYDLAIIEDISDRIRLETQHRRVEADLRHQRNLLRTFLDNLPHIAWLKDREGRFIATNAAFATSCGFTPQALVGKTDYDLWPPELARAYRDDDFAVMASGRQQRVEEPLVTADGTRCWIDTIKTPIFGEDGEVLGTVGIAIDITDRKQVEADLLQSEARLLEAQELAHVGNWEYDLPTGKTTWSKELLRQYGLNETIQGPTFEEFVACIHPEDWPEVEQAIQALMTEGIPYVLHHRIVRPDGTLRSTLCRGQAIVDEQGQVVKLFGVSQDITETQSTQQALQDSEQKYRALVEALPDLIIHMTGDGVYLDFFAASDTVVIGETENLIGQDIYEQGLPYELAKLRMGYIHQALDTGELQVYEQTLFNGQETVTEEIRIVPAGDFEVLIIVRDVTEKARLEAQRQQAVQELRASQEFVQQITDSSPNVIYIYDIAQQRNIFVNREVYTFLGYTREEMMEPSKGSTLTLMHPEDQDRAREYFADLTTLADGEIAEFEYRMQHKNGEWRWFFSRDRVFQRDATGQVTQVLGNAQDITPLKQSQLALQHSNAELEAIFAASPDLLFRIDREGVILDYKASADNTDIYMPPEQFLGRRMAEILPAEICARFYEAAEQALTGQTLVTFEYQLPVAGQPQDFEARLVPFQHQQVISTIRNITTRKQTERALQISEERLRFALDAASMGNWDWDIATDTIVWSESLERMMGLAPGSFDGSLNTLTAMIYPDDRQRVGRAIAASLEQDENYEIEFRFVKPDGSIRWALSKGNIMRDADGQPVRMAGIDIEITARKELELALQESESTLADVLNSAYWSSIVRFRVLADGQWTYDYQSPGCETLFGYTSEEILADQNLWMTHVYAEDLDTIIYPLFKDIFKGHTKTIEFRYHHKDGSLRWIAATYVSRYDKMADCWVVTGISQDISERKQAELDLQHTTEELDRFFSTALDLLCIANTDGYFLRLNPAWEKTLGYSQEELKAKRFLDFVHADDLANTQAAITRLSEQQDLPHFVNRYRHRDGSYRWLEWRSFPTGNLIYAAARDITDRIEAETRLEHQNALLAQIARGEPAATILQALIQEIEQQLPDTLCSILLLDEDNRLRHGASQKLPNAYVQLVEGVEMGDGVGSCGTAAWRNEMVIVTDIAHDPLWCDFKAVALRFDLRACWSFPIVGSGGKVLGVFGTYYQTVRSPQAQELQLLGQIAHLAGIAIERQQSEAAITASEARFRQIAETVREGFFVVNLKTSEGSPENPSFAYINPAYAAITGFEPETIAANCNLWFKGIHPSDQARISAAMQRQMQGASFDEEYRYTRPDGGVRWLRSQAFPVADDHGVVTRIVGTIEDITDRKQAEIALQESEQLYAALTEHSPVGVYQTDLNGNALYVNPTWCQLAGITPTEAAGPNWVRALHPEDRERVATAWYSAAQQQAPFVIECRFQQPSGEIVWIYTQAIPLIDNEKGFAGYIGTVTDITDRKQAEAHIQEISQRLSLATDAAKIGIWDWDVVNNRLVWDDRMYELYRITSSDADETYETFQHRVHPDDRQRVDAAIQAALTGEAEYHPEFRIVWPDGQIRFIEAHAITLRDAEGTPQRMIGVNRDISDRKQASLALHDSEAKYRRIVETANEGIWVIDADNATTFVNPKLSDLLGYTPVEMLGKQFLNFMDEAAQRMAKQNIERRQQGIVEQHDFRFKHRDGHDVWVLLSTSPIFDEAGEYAGALAMVTDISDRKQAELALLQLNEELEDRVQQRTQALVRSERDLRTIFNHVYDAIYVHDLDGTILDVNDRALELSGATREQLLGAGVAALSGPEAPLETVADCFSRAMVGETLCIEWQCRRLDDNTLYDTEVTVRQVNLWDRTVLLAGVRDISDRKRAEQALHDSEERLRLALMASNQGLYDLNLATGNAIVSPTYVTMLGYNPANFQETNAKWLLRTHPDDRERVGNVYKDYVAGQISDYKVEFRQRTRNGSYKWILSVGKIVTWDDDGNPLRMLGTHTDIDDRKQAEVALQESEERFRQIANNISEVFWLATPDHNILYASPAYEQVWGRPASSIDPDAWLETLYPEDLARFLAEPDGTFARYPAKLLQLNSEIEYRIVRPDGEIRWIRDRAFPVYNSQGQIHRIAGVSEDITERKRLEQEQHRLLSVLEASPDHIGIALPDGTPIWNNRQAKQFRGLPLDTDVTQVPLEIYHPQWAQEVVRNEAIPTALHKGIWMGETALLTADEQEIPVSQLVWAHRSETGKVEYLSTIMRDISDLKRAEQALRQANADLETRVAERTAELVEARDAAESANQAKSIFLANMSHELRTPLNAILGFSQLIRRDQTLPKQHLEELKIINRSGEHLLTLINDILEMSKIEAGQATFNPEPFNLSLLLNNLVDMLRLKAESKGLSFSLTSHTSLPQYFYTDSHKLRQVLLNLLSNAIKFTRVGYVTLRVTPADLADLEPTHFRGLKPTEDASNLMALRFEIEDSGAGIAPEEMDLLFKPFVQTSSGRLSQEGTGLGLPISYQFVQLMGGTLMVTSQPDMGSTFAFTIPVQQVDAAAIEPAEVPRRVLAISPGQPEYRILIVEDNWANRVLLQNLLIDLGFTVKTAVNGQEAIDYWQSWQPHLIFMDIRMPVMNGYEATREIRHREQLLRGQQTTEATTKIISLTAGVFENTWTDFDQLGFDDLIRKPIQVNDITRAIAQHLAVDYVYEAEVLQPEDSSTPAILHLTVETLQSLPKSWIAQFQQALIQLNQDQMLALIDHLPPDQAAIAQTLHRKVHNFDFELLLDLIQNIVND